MEGDLTHPHFSLFSASLRPARNQKIFLDMVPHFRSSLDDIIVLQCDCLEMDNDLEVPGGDRHHPEHSIPTMVGSRPCCGVVGVLDWEVHLGHTIDKSLLLSHGGEDTQHSIFGIVRS